MAEEKASTIEVNEEINVLNDDDTNVDPSAATVTTDPVTPVDGSFNESVFVEEEKGRLNSDQIATEAQNTDPGESKKDDESSDSASNCSDQKKKLKKPLSPAMQRLTATKKSPDMSTKNGPSAEERKAKAELMRKSKISEHRNKEDDKRAAVLERKKRLEETERAKKEALLKKITTDVAPKNKQASMKRYSASTSNLTVLKKNKVEKEVNIDIGEGGEKAKPKTKATERPSSSLSRTRPSSSSSLLAKSKISSDNKAPDLKRPSTTEPKKQASSKAPSSRLSLNPRSASALGTTSADRRKTLPSKSTAPVKSTGATAKPTKPKTTIIAPAKPIKKADPIKKTDPMKKTASAKVSASKTTTPKKDLAQKTPEKSTATKKSAKTDDKAAEKNEKMKRPPSASKKDTTIVKTTGTTPKKPQTPKSESTKKEKDRKKQADGKSATDTSSNQMTEEEAKKALQERRKKAKEEAEAKAKAEREKDELERQRREEEEKRLAQQLKEEEERQAALLEQLKEEEEERKQKMMEEKEQREKEEKERLETEAKQRDDEIQRKAKIEAEKIQREQQKKDQESEAERIERKKRVESIMARVSANRSASGSTDSPAKSPSPPNELSTPVEDSLSPPLTSATRQKVDGILKSKGLGKSLEDLLAATAKEDERAEEPLSQHSTLIDVAKLDNEEFDVHITVEGSINESNKHMEPATPEIVEPATLETVEPATLEAVEPATSETVEPVPVSIEPVLVSIEPVPVDVPSEPLVDIVVEDGAFKTINNGFKSQSVTVVVDNGDVLGEPVAERLLDDNVPSADLLLNDNNNSRSEVATEKLDSPSNDQKQPELQIEYVEPVDQEIKEPDTVSSEVVDREILVMDEKPTEAPLTNGTPVTEEDLSRTTEQEQWGEFEVRMKQLNDQSNDENVTVSSEESKLWKVAEGKVELSECF